MNYLFSAQFHYICPFKKVTQKYKHIFYDKFGESKVQGLNSPLFYGGIGIKLLLGFLLASPYLTELFAPFLTYAVQNGNAYEYFANQSELAAFPYPALMLWIFQIPASIVNWFYPLPTQAGYIHLVIYRLVCLVFDFAILLVLLRWLKASHKKVLIYYWLSPILIYITYIHGQLDVVPIALLIVSLHFLFKEKGYLFAFFLALAICTKTSIALAVPFVVIYRWRYSAPSLKKVLLETCTFILTVLAINLPYLQDGYIAMVFQNEVQQRVFLSRVLIGGERYFVIIPAIMLLLIYRMYAYKWVSRDLLLLYLAFAFGALTLFISPMQGWYYWIIPFFVYFIIKYNGTATKLFIFINVLYFLYFAVVPESDFLILHNFSANASFNSIFELLHLNILHVNIAFTLLQTIVIVFLFVLYKSGIQIHSNTKLFSQPYLIGISGDSGSGKSTLSKMLSQLFGQINTTVIRGDDMHKWERGHENWNHITHLNPKANNLNQDINDIKQLKDGYTVLRKKYDHQNGKFTLPFQIKSNRLVLFEGLHSFYLQSQSNLYDLKIYLDPESSILFQRKINRDVKERGKDAESVIKQIEDRKNDSSKYIQSQREMADLLICHQIVDEKEAVSITIPAEIVLDTLLIALSRNANMDIKHEFLENRKQNVIFNGTVETEVVELIAYDEFQILYELGMANAQWESGYNGIIQLMVCACMLHHIQTDMHGK